MGCIRGCCYTKGGCYSVCFSTSWTAPTDSLCLSVHRYASMKTVVEKKRKKLSARETSTDLLFLSTSPSCFYDDTAEITFFIEIMQKKNPHTKTQSKAKCKAGKMNTCRYVYRPSFSQYSVTNIPPGYDGLKNIQFALGFST